MRSATPARVMPGGAYDGVESCSARVPISHPGFGPPDNTVAPGSPHPQTRIAGGEGSLAKSTRVVNTEPHGSVFEEARCRLRGTVGPDAPRDPGTARPRKRHDHRSGARLRDHADRDQEAWAGARERRTRGDGKGRSRARLLARTAHARPGSRVHRLIPADARGPPQPTRGFPRAHQVREVMTATTSGKATVTPVGDREVRIERIFNASRDRVWKAMTDPKLVAQWWGRGNKLVVEKYELKRGGHWRYVEHSDHGEHGFEGRFAEIEAPKRVEMTFEWDG